MLAARARFLFHSIRQWPILPIFLRITPTGMVVPMKQLQRTWAKLVIWTTENCLNNHKTQQTLYTLHGVYFIYIVVTFCQSWYGKDH